MIAVSWGGVVAEPSEPSRRCLQPGPIKCLLGWGLRGTFRAFATLFTTRSNQMFLGVGSLQSLQSLRDAVYNQVQSNVSWGASGMIDIDLGFVTINENIPMMNQNKRQKTTKIEIRISKLKF